MAPYPRELRVRVVAAVEEGGWSIPEAARIFQVGLAFIKKMLRGRNRSEEEAYLAKSPGEVRGKREGAGCLQTAAAQALAKYSSTSRRCWRSVVTTVKIRSTN
jgi:transposase-like protein